MPEFEPQVWSLAYPRLQSATQQSRDPGGRSCWMVQPTCPEFLKKGRWIQNGAETSGHQVRCTSNLNYTYVALRSYIGWEQGVGKPWKTYLMDILWPPTSPQVIFEGGGSPPHVGTVLHMTGLQEFQPSDAKGLRAGVVLPSGEVLALRIGDGPTLGWGAQQHGNVALQWLTMPVDLASMGNKINKCL